MAADAIAREPEREITAEERQWWNALRTLLRRMPKSVELHARVGEIGIAPAGSGQRESDREGDADTMCETEWHCLSVPRLDGRDSHL